MNAAAPVPEERLLEFEVGGLRYALPITGVSEVTELGPLAAVPTLPVRVGGVMNHHGDALPVVHREALFEAEPGGLPAPQHLLVLAESPDEAGRLGVPVDHVVGLLNGAPAPDREAGPVVEERFVEERTVSVLDPARLLRRAAEVIRNAVDDPAAPSRGEGEEEA